MERHTLSRIKLPTKIKESYFCRREARDTLPSKSLGSRTNLFPPCACIVLLRPLDGGSSHLQIEKEGCGRARGPPALRKLGQSKLVTSPLMEAASSVWLFLYCRRWCRETSWFLRTSVLIIWAEISLYLPGREILDSVPPSLGTGLSPPRPLHLPHSTLSPMLEVHFLSCL